MIVIIYKIINMANGKKDNGSKAATEGTEKTAETITQQQMSAQERRASSPNLTDQPTETVEASPSTDRKAKMEALKKASAGAREKAVTDSMNKLELFDTTKSSDWKTTGTHTLGSMKKDANTFMITGRNIGAEQREPEWTPEQMEVIDRAKRVVLTVAPVNNTRRSVMDPEMEYVGRDPDNGSIVPTEKAYVSTLDPSMYCIGIGPEKYDTTGSPRYYSDVVVADIGGRWLVNQWTSEGVVLEGVAPNVLMQANRPGNTSGRRIGQHFARIGLPAHAFGPLFNTLAMKFEGCTSQVTPTRGYYWMNASWGVSSFAATFSYLNKEGKIDSTNSLQDVMRMLNGKSSLCLGTVAISITCNAKMVDMKPVPDKSSYGLSVKMHNAFSVNVVDYHGPPQQGSTGMMIPTRIAQKAQAMGKSLGVATGGSLNSIFSNKAGSVFGDAGKQVPSVKTTENKDYM